MTFGWILLTAICVSIGLIMYAKYHGCDPYQANVSVQEKLFIIFILNKLELII